MIRLLSALLGVLLVAGCQAPQAAAPNPFVIDAREYDRIYAAAVESLRDAGFRVDRQDYRFGQISTHPQTAPTAVELWDPDNSTGEQALMSTFNHVQRVARVMLVPAGDADGDADGDEAAAAPETYELHVEVLMERRQQPTRRLSGTVGRQVFSRLDAVPTELRDRGIDPAYWQTLGRDPHLEQCLLQTIIRRAVFGG